MLINPKKCSLALAVSSAIALSGCGGGGDSENSSASSNVATYSYQNMTPCADTDLDGACSSYEQEVIATSSYSRMLDVDGAILTAPKDTDVVSPFTTLIHSEMMFNPSLGGDLASVKSYLQSALGDHVNVDFTTADINHGPEQATALLMQSLKQAQTQGSSTPIVNIAHALDKMIEHKTLDLSGINLSTSSSRHISLDSSVFVHGSQSDSSLSTMKSISINPANSTLLYLDQQDNVKQFDTNAKQTSSLRNLNRASLSSYDDDDDNDDDDDDDDYGGSIGNIPGYNQSSSSKLIMVVPELNSVQTYKLYQPTTTATQSFTCATEGSNGIFLSKLNDGIEEAQPSVSARKVSIDAYGGASGGTTPLPTPPPATNEEVKISSAHCFNDNFEWMLPLHKQDSLIARINNGTDANGDQLKRLELKQVSKDKTDLIMSTSAYGVKSGQTVQAISQDETELLVVSSTASENPRVVDSNTMMEKRALDLTNVLKAGFTTNNQIVAGLSSQNKVIWVENSSQASQVGSVNIDGTIRHLAASPDGKSSVAITNTTLYLLDNVNHSITKQSNIDGTDVLALFVLDDKVITVHSTSFQYFQFANISGPKLKVAGQLITKELVADWGNSASAHWQETNMAYLLKQTGAEDSVANQFQDVTLSWNPANATQASEVTGVYISGFDRGEWIELHKDL